MTTTRPQVGALARWFWRITLLLTSVFVLALSWWLTAALIDLGFLYWVLGVHLIVMVLVATPALIGVGVAAMLTKEAWS